MVKYVRTFVAKSLEPSKKLGMIFHIAITQNAMKDRDQRLTAA